MTGSFAAFAERCEQLTATSRKLEKRALMGEYLRSLEAHDAARAALYFSGKPFPETAARQLNVGGALLSRVLAELSKASQAAMHTAYLRHGDLGAAAHDLLIAVWGRRNVDPTLSLAEVDAAFAAVADAQKAAVKQKLVEELLERATPLEAKYIIKIILGDLRTGVKQSLVEEAIAAAYEAPLSAVRRAMTLNGDLAEVLMLAAKGRLEDARMKLFHPLGFMLASPVATVEEALERFIEEESSELEAAAHETGDSSQAPVAMAQGTKAQTIGPPILGAQIEDKYDGVRAQIHCGDPEQPGRVALFSRTREDMTPSFPEIVEAFGSFQEPVILDGEILAWNPNGSSGGDPTPGSGRALPFTTLQPRLGRKQVTAKMRQEAPVVFMTFDLLYAAGTLLLERPLAERRQALVDLVTREETRTIVGNQSALAPQNRQATLQFDPPQAAEAGFPRLVLAPAVKLQSAEQLEQAYVDARARGNEGVMLKAQGSAYLLGRRGLAWLKLKRELATLDVVVTAAEYGHGKRAGILSDYTFAVRDAEDLKNIGKAYSGLTDAEIATLTEFFKKHTLEDFGSVRTVEPIVVLEVAFNNVMRSDRHNSGFALRFPRIIRIRNDKPVSEIDTIERVAEIYHSQ
ncbi:MAG TPA: ATP-dependent DNA ligase [Acidobacteriaceae bacterium]